MTEMRKAYTKPETWATKALFEGPLLSETYVETGGNRTGIMNYTDANPDGDSNISFNVRQHNLWEDDPEESNPWSY
jgi:hypothetical protein